MRGSAHQSPPIHITAPLQFKGEKKIGQLRLGISGHGLILMQPLQIIKLNPIAHAVRQAADSHDTRLTSPPQQGKHLHLVRSFRKDQVNPAFEAFYKILYTRLLRRLPRPDKEHSTALTAEAIRDHALDRFRKWLSADLQEYEERLDFFEVRFDMAMKKLRANAEASVLEKVKKQKPLTSTDDGQVTEEVEKAAAKAFAEGAFNFDSGSEAYRFALDEVIDTLSSDEGRVIHMLRLGMQIDSIDPHQPTISKALGKSEKTIRNMRDRAFVKIRNALSAKGHK
jgi:arginyl-tRNA synthetase